MHIKSRPAIVGDKLKTWNFGTGTRGFADMASVGHDASIAVCLLPGTELAFDKPIEVYGAANECEHKTAIFRQINKEQLHMHHDTLELPDGKQLLLTFLAEGQHATVLQLPAAPRNEAEEKEQTRLEVVG